MSEVVDETYTGGVQTFTATVAGTYDITVYGAQGGAAGSTGQAIGGLGAEITGEIFLAAGAQLEIIVGGEGQNSTNSGGGGGGGSYVIETKSSAGVTLATPIVELVAGGGGGGGYNGGNGGNASGGSGSGDAGGGQSAGAGGANGSAGGGGLSGGGGGGFTGGAGASGGSFGAGGQANKTSFAGGSAPRAAGGGGYGGGGGGGSYGGGGGGGYGGGGGGGGHVGGSGGGGGGSYANTQSVSNSTFTPAAHSGDGEVSIVTCYLAGSHILTDRGEVAVETLAIGDVVVTASGAHRPIKWIGHRSYSARFARNNAPLHPVCFKAGSLADNTPHTDLWVSPRHAMLLDGALIPAERLVNAETIVQPLPTGEVRYFHVELESHDVLVANGAASESFLDDDSRAMFHNAASYDALYVDEPLPATLFCAPRVEAGAALDRVRRRLAQRAGLAAQRSAEEAAAA